MIFNPNLLNRSLNLYYSSVNVVAKHGRKGEVVRIMCLTYFFFPTRTNSSKAKIDG